MRQIIIVLVISLLSGCGSFWELVMTDDERQLLRQSAKSAAACQVSRYLQAPMWHKDMYMRQQGSCQAIPLRDEVWFGDEEAAPLRAVYSDVLCRQPVQFQLTRYHNFCSDYALPQRLGNDVELAERQAWTLNPASRFRLPLLKQYALVQPFMTARIYRQVDVSEQRVIEPDNQTLNLRRGNGVCQLQMRIYKRHPNAPEGKPLLMFHGGGGHQRNFHLLALESRIPEYTNQGYTVYLPFYRLMQSGDTNPECSNASWEEVRSDAEAALAWVQENHSEFGPPAAQVSLFAQGSGALLAGWLHTRHSAAIARSIFFYPLLDSRSMRQQILVQGGYSDGRATLERLLGQPLEQVSEDNVRLQETSYLQWIAQSKQAVPPMVLLHGMKDQRIPHQQTALACQTLAEPAGEVSTQGDVLHCGASRAYLLSGAENQLDYCFSGVECPAGDRSSRKQVKAAIEQAHEWLQGERH